MLVPVFLTITVAPGRTAPVVSMTRPSTLPVAALCANAVAGANVAPKRKRAASARAAVNVRSNLPIETPQKYLMKGVNTRTTRKTQNAHEVKMARKVSQ